MKEITHLNEIYAPEYYHEIEGYDCRLAIRKIIDTYLTLSDAAVSLTYTNKDEYPEDNFETRIMRRTHLRHAIIDLNNCFDLLLQIPWFYYRIGLTLNTDIIRNSDSWIEHLEEECKINKVINFLISSPELKKNTVGNGIKNFKDRFVFNNNKAFTVRSLSNYLKHKGILKLKEFDSPLKLTINNEGADFASSIKTIIEAPFFDEKSPSVVLGKIRIISTENALVDIEYNPGELFRGVDYSYSETSLPMDDIYSEAIDFFDNLIELLEIIYCNIYEDIPKSPFLNIDKVQVIKNNTINLDMWYKKEH